MERQEEISIIEAIRADYVHEETDLEKLRKLDKKVKFPACVASCIVGAVSSLVLGTGMCLAMGVMGGGSIGAMAAGVVIGAVGLVVVGCNYFLYKRLERSRKSKYAKEIVSLSDKLLNGQN